jgi:lipopolysaccharide/colanic/teichoic acid biosynthesis glycosyltransferase
VLDVAVAVVALLVTAPVLLLAALLVRINMGAPVLFRHERAGMGARPFSLLKLRTMREAASGEDGPQHDAARTSRLGAVLRRSSIDELPSLVNVLRGEMSLVGPRPLPVSYVERYSPEQRRRLEVRPGLTGWAVVNGRNRLSWEERLTLDCWYVDHRSFALDLKILWRSLGLIVSGAHVNHAPGVTMTEFGGERLQDGS